MKILVTGASGFIGQTLVRTLIAAGDEVVGLDQRPMSDKADLQAHPGFVEEIVDANSGTALAAILERHGPEVIVALADSHRAAPADAVAESVIAQRQVLRAATASGVRRVAMASSIAVYMGLDGPFLESMPLPLGAPLHIAEMKKASEIAGIWHARHTGLEFVAMRLANIYGPRYHSMMNTPSRALFEALGRPISASVAPIDADTYRQLADFCHVHDCCAGISLVAKAPKLAHQVYNIGGGRAVSDADIRHAAAAATGQRNARSSGGEESSNYLDISRLSAELGYVPRYDINSGMAAYAKWLGAHPL